MLNNIDFGTKSKHAFEYFQPARGPAQYAYLTSCWAIQVKPSMHSMTAPIVQHKVQPSVQSVPVLLCKTSRAQRANRASATVHNKSSPACKACQRHCADQVKPSVQSVPAPLGNTTGAQRAYLASTVGPQQAEQLVVVNGEPGVLDGPVVLGGWPALPCTAQPPHPIPARHTASHTHTLTLSHTSTSHVSKQSL